jgi:hypothetical protein
VHSTLGSRRREETRRFDALAVAISFVLRTAAPARISRARHAKATLRFFMTSARRARIEASATDRDQAYLTSLMMLNVPVNCPSGDAS